MHPYRGLPRQNFWKNCAETQDFARDQLYRPKIRIGAGTRVATAGSCFAQHVGRYLRASNAELIDVEPAPQMMAPETARRFGYGLFSARYGNIYTTRQWRQLLQDAADLQVHADAIWQRGDRFWDALRPGVEPEGLDSAEEVVAHRREHLARVHAMLAQADVFVFTLGLTEMWTHTASGRAYPIAPGVIAGHFDAHVHHFVNADYPSVLSDLQAVRTMLRARNPDMKLILTVSPVALAATASQDHVLAATAYSKSVLRAAAGAMVAEHDDVDYVPSFEVIAGTPSCGRYYAGDLREVTPEGVATAMAMFFAAHPGLGEAIEVAKSAPVAGAATSEPDDDVICEERLLEAFRE